MNVSILSETVVIFLAPFLPYLLKVGEKATEEIGENVGAAAWEQAKALWNNLSSKLKNKPTAQEAMQDLAKSPNDEDAITILRIQLKKLLDKDTELTQELTRIMEQKVVQRVLAERDSSVRGVEQTVTGGADVRQDIIAQDNSTIENIRQRNQ
jgi:hypothetical protein